MATPVRILAALPGIFMLLLGLRWVFDPAGAAGALGMPLLDGMGRSTQVGDVATIFLATAAMIGVGVIRQSRPWLHAAALVLGCVAVMRTLAWVAHGADFAAQAVAAEAVMTAVLLFAAARIRADA